MNKYLRLWTRNFALELQSDMIYKLNFFIKLCSFVIADFVTPLVTILIYAATPGIPGWSLEEFILFQGSFILLFALARVFYLHLPQLVIKAIRDGSFDKYLVKPFNPLMQLTLSSWNIEGFAEVLAGLALIIWAGMQLSITLANVAWFAVIVILGNIFLYALMVIIAAVAFLVVQSFALYDIFFRLTDFGRYPLNIYAGVLKAFLVFVFPIGVVAFYPAQALLGLISWSEFPTIVIPVVVFFAFAMFLWNRAMKSYTSAGG